MTDSREKRFALACVAAGLVVVADQATKAAAIAGLSATEGLPLLGDLVTLRLAFNPGGVLSFGAQAPWLLTALGLVSIALIATAMIRARTTPWAVGLGIILGGAIGNTVDRLFSQPGFGVGHVTDFLAYGTLFIGNLAFADPALIDQVKLGVLSGSLVAALAGVAILMGAGKKNAEPV